MYLAVIRSRPTAWCKVTIEHNNLYVQNMYKIRNISCQNNIKLFYLTFIQCTCEFEKHKQPFLGESCERTLPDKGDDWSSNQSGNARHVTRTRVLRRPIVFLCVRCSVPHCTCRETGWKGVTGLIWLMIGTTFSFYKMREDPWWAEELLSVVVEHRCARFCNVRCPPWAALPSCGVLSDRERWLCSGVLYTLVCLRPASIVSLYEGHWSVSTAVECKLRSLCAADCL